MCTANYFEFQVPTPSRDRICNKYDLEPVLLTSSIASQQLLENDASTNITFVVRSPMNRVLTCSFVSNPGNGFYLLSSSMSDAGSVFTVRSFGNLSHVTDLIQSSTVTLVLVVSDNAPLCRTISRPLKFSSCTTTVSITVHVAQLVCPGNMIVFVDNGATYATVHFPLAEPNAAYGSLLPAVNYTVISTPANGSVLDVGLHEVRM